MHGIVDPIWTPRETLWGDTTGLLYYKCNNIKGLRKYGAWRSPVARLLWEQEVPGSNPGAPIDFTGYYVGAS